MKSHIFPYDILPIKTNSNSKRSSELSKAPKPTFIVNSRTKSPTMPQDSLKTPKKERPSLSGVSSRLAENLTQTPGTPLRHYYREPLRIPDFWVDSPELWFKLVESAFSRAGILTETRKFDEILAVLDNPIIDKIGIDLLEIEGRRPYTQLKQSLLNRFAPTEDDRLTAFLRTSDLGDQKPTDMLKHLKFLIGPERLQESFANSLLKKLFLEKLPPSIRNFLACNYDDTVENLASQADNIVKNSDFSQGDNTYVQSQIQNKLLETKINNLAESFQQLKSDLNGRNLNQPPRQQFRPRYFENRQYRRPWPPRQQQFRQNFRRESFRPRWYGNQFSNRYSTAGTPSTARRNWICPHHRSYGMNANRCEPGCTYKHPNERAIQARR